MIIILYINTEGFILVILIRYHEDDINNTNLLTKLKSKWYNMYELLTRKNFAVVLPFVISKIILISLVYVTD